MESGKKRKVSGTILAGAFTVPTAMSAVQQNAVSANLLTDFSSSVVNFFTKKARESVLEYTAKKILPTVIVLLGVVFLVEYFAHSKNNSKKKAKSENGEDKTIKEKRSKIEEIFSKIGTSKDQLENKKPLNKKNIQKEIIEKIENFDLDFDLINMENIKINKDRKIDLKINEFIYNEGYGQKEEERCTVIELKKEDVKIFSEVEIKDKNFINSPEGSVVKLYIKSVDKDGKFTFTIDGKVSEYKSKSFGKRTAFMNMVLMARCKQNLKIENNFKNKFKFLVKRGCILLVDEKIPVEDLGNNENALKDLETVKEGIEKLPKKEKYIFEDLIKKSPLSLKRLDIKKLRKMSIKAFNNNEELSDLSLEKLAGKTIQFGGAALFSNFIELTENNKMSLSKKVVLKIFESEMENKIEKERVEKRVKEKIRKNGTDGSVEINWFVKGGDFLLKAYIEKDIFNLKKEYIGNPYLMNLLLLTLAKNHLKKEKHLPNINGTDKEFFIDTNEEEIKLLDKTKENFRKVVKEIKEKILRDGNMVDIIKDTREDLDLYEFKDTLKNFAEVQKNVKTMVTLNPNIPVMVVGDIHNNQAALEHVIMEFLKKKQKGEKVQLLFTGDYSDRGKQGPYEEGSAPDAKVWYLLMKLKILYKDEVFLLRGNHEDEELAKREDPDQGESFARMLKYFKNKGHEDEELKALESEVNENFFKSLSVAAKYGDTLLMHGGLPVNIQDLKGMFGELAGSNDKNLPFEEGFNKKYPSCIIKEFEIKEEELSHHIKWSSIFYGNGIDNAKNILLKEIDKKEKSLDEKLKLINDFCEKCKKEDSEVTYYKKDGKIMEKTIKYRRDSYIGHQLLWNEFNEKDKENYGTHRGRGFYYNEKDIKTLNEKCGYKRVINGHNHRIEDGLCITEVKEGKKKCQQIVTMGSPNMNFGGNSGHILIMNEEGETEDIKIKYDKYWGDDKFRKGGFDGDDFRKRKFTDIFEGYNEEDGAEEPKVEEYGSNIKNLKEFSKKGKGNNSGNGILEKILSILSTVTLKKQKPN